MFRSQENYETGKSFKEQREKRHGGRQKGAVKLGEKLEIKAEDLHERNITYQSRLQVWPRLHQKRQTDTGS